MAVIQLIQKTSGVDFGRPYRLGYTGLDDGLLQKYIADSVQLWQDHVEELPVSTVGGAISTLACFGIITLLDLVIIKLALPRSLSYARVFAKPAVRPGFVRRRGARPGRRSGSSRSAAERPAARWS
jgi:hypothetical protein